jgi:hypothetical protein
LVTHLNTYYNTADMEAFPTFTVEHMNPSTLALANGSDAGGLRRDWFYTCFLWFLIANNAQRIGQGQFYMPMVPLFPPDSLDIHPPVCESYQDFGTLLMYILHQPRGSNAEKQVAWFIGNLLPPAFFAGIMAWPGKELEDTAKPFSQVSLQVQMQVCQAILQAHHIDSFNRMIHLVLKENWNQEEAQEAIENLGAVSKELPAWVAGYVTNFSQISEDQKNQLIETLRLAVGEMVLEVDTSIGTLGRVVAALYHIAIGMRNVVLDKQHLLNAQPDLSSCKTQEWDTRFHNVYRDEVRRRAAGEPVPHPIAYTVRKHIQGVEDRTKIINSISIKEPLTTAQKQEVEKKVKWLKEWLADEATTDVEVTNFVIFVTGSGLGENQKIQIEGKNQTFPLPKAHTCFCTMDIPYHSIQATVGFSDHTKEGFIACVKASIASINYNGFTLE